MNISIASELTSEQTDTEDETYDGEERKEKNQQQNVFFLSLCDGKVKVSKKLSLKIAMEIIVMEQGQNCWAISFNWKQIFDSGKQFISLFFAS